MFPALRVFILGALVPLAYSQTTQVPPADTGSVEGIVVNASTREPLKKAWVTLMKAEGPGMGPGSQGALTDAAGRFALKDIEPGRYRMFMTRNGYVSQQYGAQQGPASPGTTLSISPGQTIRDIQVAMIPSGVITGRIYDDDGEPVVNVLVMALKSGYREGRRELQPVNTVGTNDLGEFRIYGLAPGSYFLSATFQGWNRPPIAAGAGTAIGSGPGEEMGYAPTYYPGTNDLGRAVPIDLKSGDDVSGMDINLLSTRAVRIRGRILSTQTGKGEARAWVILMPRETKVRTFSPSARTSVNNPEGEFELRGVVPGLYTLNARSTMGGEDFYQARIPLEVGPSDINGLIVPLGKGAEIPGRLRWEGDDQSKSDRKVQVYLQPKEQGFMMGGGGSREPKPDGSFLLKNVVDGEYKVMVYGTPEDCYLRSTAMSGEDVLANGVTISAGRYLGPLEIVMNCSGGILEGIVVAEQANPMPGVSVVLVPDKDRRVFDHLFKETTTDQHGRFSIRGIAPGEYKAFAWDKIESGAYQDPEFMRRFESAGKPVAVGEGGRLSVQLTVILTDKAQE